MNNFRNKILQLGDKSLDLSTPVVMGILNVTPDSFFDGSINNTELNALKKTEQMIIEGACIIDIGALSTKPGATIISIEEEWSRLGTILKSVRHHFSEILISVDTSQSEIVRRCNDVGVNIINDISAGQADQQMLETIAKLNTPYVAMHMKGTPETMQINPTYENVVEEVKEFLQSTVTQLHQLGHRSTIFIDPGFGFGKTLEHNYQLLRNLDVLKSLDKPVVTGLSRKSMINKILKTNPDKALNGTTVMNTIALLRGANVLRVHDVKEAMETIKLVNYYSNETSN